MSPAPQAVNDTGRTAGRRYGDLLRWLLVFVLLPNLPFIALQALLPFDQTFFALLFGLIGTMAGLMVWSVVPMVLMTVVLAGNVLIVVCTFFGLEIHDALEHAHLLTEIDPLAEPLYLVAFVGMTACYGAAFTLLARWFGAVRRVSPWLAALVVLALPVPFSMLAGASDARHGGKEHDLLAFTGLDVASPHPVASAASLSGFAAPEAIEAHRHLLIVIVEAMGQPKASEARQDIFAAFDRPGIAARFTVTRGTVPYAGSTTAAEMRELCGTSASYRLVRDGAFATDDCLPARLAAHGYRTAGLHGMTGGFFERLQWWPRIGLGQSDFLEQFAADPALGRCGVVFSGICDPDLVPVIGARLRQARAPQFLYWLTLNTHVPVASATTRALGCDREPAPFGTARVCTLGRMWRDLFAILAAELERPDMPPVDILLVGDHAPPLFFPADRGQFEPGVVPWILLKARENAFAARLPAGL